MKLREAMMWCNKLYTTKNLQINIGLTFGDYIKNNISEFDGDLLVYSNIKNDIITIDYNDFLYQVSICKDDIVNTKGLIKKIKSIFI